MKTMICTKCGAGLTTSQTFCHRCGVKLHHVTIISVLADESAIPVDPVSVSAEPVTQDDAVVANEPAPDSAAAVSAADPPPADASLSSPADQDKEPADPLPASGTESPEPEPEQETAPPTGSHETGDSTDEPAMGTSPDPRMEALQPRLVAAIEAHRHEEALALCEEMSRLDPGNPEWGRQAAELRDEARRLADALADAERALAGRRFAEARDICEKLLTTVAHAPGPSRLLDKIEEHERQFHRQLRRVERMLDRDDPDGALAQIEAMIDQDEALDDVDEVIALRARVDDINQQSQQVAERRRRRNRTTVTLMVLVPVLAAAGYFGLRGGDEAWLRNLNWPSASVEIIEQEDDVAERPDQEIRDMQATLVDSLLNQAAVHMFERRLLTPPGNCAFELIEQVFRIDADNAQASEMVREMAVKYESWGDRALQKNEPGEAVSYFDRSLHVLSRMGQSSLFIIVKKKRDEAQSAVDAAVAQQQAEAERVAREQAEQEREARARAQQEREQTTRIAPTGSPVRLERKLEMWMVPVAPGRFMMGSPSSDRLGQLRKEWRHRVTISKPFSLGRTEVTQAQWQRVMGENPSKFKGGNLPVERISWYDAVRFCNELSRLAGLEPAYDIQGTRVTWNQQSDGYRLPTEAEWEYACRAGSKTMFCSGNSESGLSRFAWHEGNSDGKPHPVGVKQANAWGFHDMHGNVNEYCWDWYRESPRNSVTDPIGPRNGELKVSRGGSWNFEARHLRSSSRGNGRPSVSSSYVTGLRVARSTK